MTSRPRNVHVLLRDESVVVVRDNVEQARLRWSDVDLIEGYKQDLVIVDLIVIRLTNSATGQFLDIDEEMDGYDAFQKEVERRYPGRDENWWCEVAFPAFAENLTTIWKRPS